MAEQTIKVPRLYQQVAEKLIEMIESGEYDVGSRLPAERELAAMFSVSRPTIREAVIALELENFVEVRTGSGVYVKAGRRESGRLADKDIGPFELTEARILFEGEAAALAARMITDAELRQLESILGEMAAENESGEEMHEEADKKFHMTIAQATRNSAVVSVIEGLWDARESSPLTRRMYQRVRNKGFKPSIEEHRDVFNAIATRDPAIARAAMREHLTRVIDSILEATEVEAIEAARSEVAKSRERYSVARKLG
ncbi:FadR/GntR family transcriptional regulator [Pseudokordiimonas caeni]|uniref:FadR/GntR family transcriptional regulator n=1 Tax=Pseudokordiimonas caeni TaxID=2997908 RepID=UPI0028119994|nr:FadR/GntR family transcriptional regulator [Pseudokordiimonas caeni]